MYRFTLWFIYAAIIFCLMLYGVYMPFNEEGLHHYNCLSVAEAFNTAKLSYLHMNPRIGEMASYLFGHQAGAYYLVLHITLGFAAIMLMFRLGTGLWPAPKTKDICVLMFTFLCFLGFTSDTDWYLANMSWLYPCVLALCFFCLTENFFKGDFQISVPRFLASLPLAIVTGMSNNNTAIVSWILMAGCGLYYFLYKKSVRITWQYVIILSILTISCCLYYIAPGHYTRAEVANWELSVGNIFFNSILNPNNWILSGVLLWRLLLSGIILAIVLRTSASKLNKVRTVCLILTLFLLWGVLILAPNWGAPRSYLTLELLITCILVQLYFSINIALHWRSVILIIHALIMSTQIIPSVGKLISSHREWQKIEKMATEAKAKGAEYIIVKASDLDFTPTFSRLGCMPGSFFNYRMTPRIPLMSAKEQHTTHLNHQHKWIKSTWTADSGDHVMNPIAAKKLGLKAVYYLPDK